MGSGVNNLGIMNYRTISNEIRLLYEGVGTFKKKRVSVAESFKSFSAYLANQNFSHPFPAIEKEIGDIISRWNVSESLDKLRIQLDGYFSKIAFIDREIDKIETLQQKLFQYPDRHNRKAVTDKIKVFSQNVNKVSLSQIDKICNEVIPSIHRMVDTVLQGFSEESNNVEKNKKSAQHLKKRIDGYSQYVDRFNLQQRCIEANRVAEQILQTPNMANPDADATKLKQANQSLDQCMAQFKAEDILYDKIKQALSDNWKSVWLEDYDALMLVLEKGACYEETPASQLQARFDSLIGVKDKDITKALSVFSSKYQSYFSYDIKPLREEAHYKSELRELIEKINRKVAADKKKLYMKIAKIAGIVAAIILFIVIMIACWPWSGIIVGIIVASIIYGFIKDS